MNGGRFLRSVETRFFCCMGLLHLCTDKSADAVRSLARSHPNLILPHKNGVSFRPIGCFWSHSRLTLSHQCSAFLVVSLGMGCHLTPCLSRSLTSNPTFSVQIDSSANVYSRLTSRNTILVTLCFMSNRNSSSPDSEDLSFSFSSQFV